MRVVLPFRSVLMLLLVVFGGVGLCGGSVVLASGSNAQRTAFRALSLRNFLMGIGFSGVLGSILGVFRDFVIPLSGDSLCSWIHM